MQGFGKDRAYTIQWIVAWWSQTRLYCSMQSVLSLSFSLCIVSSWLFPLDLSDYIMLSRSKSIYISFSRECTLKKKKKENPSQRWRRSGPKWAVYSWKAVSILIGVSVYVLRSSVRPSAAQWTQSGTNAAADQIPNRHLLRPRLPCIAQVTAHHNSTMDTRAEVTRGARPRPARTATATGVVDPRGMIRRLRNGAGSGVAAAPNHPQRVPTDARAQATRIGNGIVTVTVIATATVTENARASIQEGTGRGRDHAAGLARGTGGVVAVVIAAETGTGTGRAADTTPGRPRMNRTL